MGLQYTWTYADSIFPNQVMIRSKDHPYFKAQSLFWSMIQLAPFSTKVHFWLTCNLFVLAVKQTFDQRRVEALFT